MNRFGRLVATSVVLALAGSLLLTSPAAAATGTGVSPSSPMSKETFTVSATLGSKVARPVRLQKYTSGRWKTVKTGKSTSKGKVSLTTSTTKKVAVRIYAPKVKVKSRTYKSVTTTKRTVSVASQSVAAAWQRGTNDSVVVTVTSKPARAGRPVRLERRGGSAEAWKPLPKASGTLDSAGRAVLRSGLGVPEARGAQVRVVALGWKGAAAAASSLVADPSGGARSVTVRPVDLTGRNPGDAVTLRADVTGQVDRVRFLVDGRPVGEDATSPFTATWTVREGRHDVVARAFFGRRSVASTVVMVDVPERSVGADSGLVEGFGLEEVQSGFELPTSVAAVPGGPVFVSEKAGRVRMTRLDGEDGWSSPRTVLDIADDVYDDGDAGMVGITTDPDFDENGFVYVSYVLEGTADGDAASRSQQVARFTWDADGDRLVPDSRRIVLGSVTGPACHAEENVATDDCLPLIGQAHTVGELAFDGDGNLLVGVGDGALYAGGLAARVATLRAQDPDVLAGKVLRVDPATGRGVPANPLHTGDGSSNASRVAALGFRNPFRFTVDGDRLVVGDVGEGAHEELDVVDLDRDTVPNYGWPCREGNADTDVPSGDPESPWRVCAGLRSGEGAVALLAPAHTYPHSGGGSVTAGAFLTSEAYPEEWRGRYLFGDYAQNFLKAGRLEDGTLGNIRTLADDTAAAGPVKIITGPDGLVWYLSIYTGSLRRLTYGPAGVDRCEVGTFRRSFHDLDGEDSVFDREYPDDDWRWLFPYADAVLPEDALAEPTCEPTISLKPTAGSPWTTTDTREHPGDRFGTAWRGRVNLEAGRYRFRVNGSEWMRLDVDGKPLHDFYSNDFWRDDRAHDITLDAGQHVVTAELIHGDERDAYAGVTWERIGGPPEVSITAPANGTLLAGDRVDWKVTATDPDAPKADLTDSIVVTADLMHYSDGVPHSHPQRRADGKASGSFILDDEHAPGHSAWRLRATATDADGSRTTSAPLYVCLAGNRVGPCQD